MFRHPLREGQGMGAGFHGGRSWPRLEALLTDWKGASSTCQSVCCQRLGVTAGTSLRQGSQSPAILWELPWWELHGMVRVRVRVRVWLLHLTYLSAYQQPLVDQTSSFALNPFTPSLHYPRYPSSGSSVHLFICSSERHPRSSSVQRRIAQTPSFLLPPSYFLLLFSLFASIACLPRVRLRLRHSHVTTVTHVTECHFTF